VERARVYETMRERLHAVHGASAYHGGSCRHPEVCPAERADRKRLPPQQSALASRASPATRGTGEPLPKTSDGSCLAPCLGVD